MQVAPNRSRTEPPSRPRVAVSKGVATGVATVVAARVAARVAALFAATLLAACGGGGSAAPTPPATNTNASAIAASKPGELLSAVKATLAARQAQGLSSATPLNWVAGAPEGAVSVTASGDAVARSNTTVQEAGVEEEDLIKSDGELIFTLDSLGQSASGRPQSRLQVYRRAADGKVSALQTLALPVDESTYPVSRGMVLARAANRLAVLAESSTAIALPIDCPTGNVCVATASLIYPPSAIKSEVRVQQVDIAASGQISAGTLAVIDGRLIGSRQIGNLLYLVTSYTPRLAADMLPTSATAAERTAALNATSLSEVLPQLRINGGAPQPLVAETDCYVQPKNASLDLAITTITAIDLGATGTSGLARATRCFVGGTEAMYMSSASIYLATTRYSYGALGSSIRYSPQASTDIHKFTVSGSNIVYKASGEVAGHLGWDAQRKPYRLSEHNGDLRVLSFTGETGWARLADAGSATAPPPSPATLSVLRERSSDASLQVLAKLPNTQRPAAIGLAGEQVYAVRFAGERGYVVTFRHTDPLYVLDLSNPADPRQAGELKLPGFSDYLFPMGDGLLFGVGKDADATGRLGGIKLALFDVRDMAAPKSLASKVMGERGSQTALDYSSHGINLFTRGNTVRVALPLTLQQNVSFSSVQSGLQRIEIDTTARTLLVKPLLPVAGNNGYVDLGNERSLQIENQVYHLSQGQLRGLDW